MAVPAKANHTLKLTQAMLSVYDGRECCGHILNRGTMGFAAHDNDDVQVGLFPTIKAAADALAALAKGGAA